MLKKTDSPGSGTISQSSREHREPRKPRKPPNPAQDYAQNSKHHRTDPPDSLWDCTVSHAERGGCARKRCTDPRTHLAHCTISPTRQES